MKVLFFDIDGTLVDHDHGINEVPVGVKKKLKELKEAGNHIFVASGRPKAFISQSIIDAGFDGFVLCNGAHVELEGKDIFEQPLIDKDIKELVALLNRLNCQYVLETKTKVYLNPEFKLLDEFFRSCHINEDELVYEFNEEDKFKDTLKVEVNCNEEDRETINSFIEGKFAYDSHGTSNAFEIFHPIISKATGIQKVLEHLNLDIKDSYAFGDGSNDFEMIKEVGTGVAMGNAVEELKDIADIVCNPVYENGLEEILNELF